MRNKYKTAEFDSKRLRAQLSSAEHRVEQLQAQLDCATVSQYEALMQQYNAAMYKVNAIKERLQSGPAKGYDCGIVLPTQRTVNRYSN